MVMGNLTFLHEHGWVNSFFVRRHPCIRYSPYYFAASNFPQKLLFSCVHYVCVLLCKLVFEERESQIKKEREGEREGKRERKIEVEIEIEI
jgi:hypothetical protein